MSTPSELNGLWDRLLLATSSQTRSVSASLEAQSAVMASIETALDPMGEGGLLDCLSRLWNRFDELSCRPASRRLREQALADAERVAASLRHAAGLLDGAADQERERLCRRVERANDLLELLQTGPDPAEGAGATDDVSDELQALLAFDPRRDTSSRYRLCFQHADVTEDDMLPLRVRPDNSVVNSRGTDIELVGGTIHGSQILLGHLLPRPRKWLDEVAARIVTSHNRLHLAGTGADGSTDIPLFWSAGLTADTFEVAFLLAGNPDRIAASGNDDGSDGSNAMALARMGSDTDGPWSVLRQGLGDLAHTVSDLRCAAEAAALSNQRAERSMQKNSASSMSRKLAGLLVTQEALQAAARFDDTLGGVLDTVTVVTGLAAGTQIQGPS